MSQGNSELASALSHIARALNRLESSLSELPPKLDSLRTEVQLLRSIELDRERAIQAEVTDKLGELNELLASVEAQSSQLVKSIKDQIEKEQSDIHESERKQVEEARRHIEDLRRTLNKLKGDVELFLFASQQESEPQSALFRSRKEEITTLKDTIQEDLDDFIEKRLQVEREVNTLLVRTPGLKSAVIIELPVLLVKVRSEKTKETKEFRYYPAIFEKRRVSGQFKFTTNPPKWSERLRSLAESDANFLSGTERVEVPVDNRITSIIDATNWMHLSGLVGSTLKQELRYVLTGGK